MALRQLFRPWTPEEDERIKAFVAEDTSLVRAAAALRRKQANAHVRAVKLGCAFPTMTEARKKYSAVTNRTRRLH
jgi:hypothetical protein